MNEYAAHEGIICCISSNGISEGVPLIFSHSSISAGIHGNHHIMIRIFLFVRKYSSRKAFIFLSLSVSDSFKSISHHNSSILLYPENRLILSIKSAVVFQDGLLECTTAIF